MIDYNKPMQFTDGDRTIAVTFSHMTAKNRIAVNVTNAADVADGYGDSPYLFNTDGKHYKSLFGDLTNVADASAAPAPAPAAPAANENIQGTSFKVNDTVAENLGAALILAGSLVAEGKGATITKITTFTRSESVADFPLAA